MATAEVVETIDPTPLQARVLAVPEDHDIFLGGGRGGGKSYALLMLAVRHVEQYGRNAHVLIVRRHHPDLRQLETEARYLFTSAYGRAVRFNSQTHVFTFGNGASVQFDQLEGPADFNKFQGKSYSLIIADEAGQFSDPQPLDLLRSSLRSRQGVPCRFVLAANPGGQGHAWLQQRFVTGVRPWVPFTDRNSGRTFVQCPSTLSDNPHLPQTYYKQLEAATATDPELAKAWLQGDWNIARGSYFASVFDTARNVVPAWSAVPSSHALEGMSPWQQRNVQANAANLGTRGTFGWQYWLALDHGSSAPCVTLLFAKSPGAEGPDGIYYPRDSMVIFDEVAFVDHSNMNTGLQMTVPAMAVQIVDRCKEWGIQPRGPADDATFSRHGSGSGSLGDEYRRHGLQIQRANKGDRIGGWEIMRRYLMDAGKPDAPGLYISERCQYWLSTVPFLGRDSRHPEDVDTTGPDHAADACRYGLLNEAGSGKIHVRQTKGF